MKIIEFIKQELTGWKDYEIIGLFIVLMVILFTTVTFNDSPIAVISAICGILYTIIAGKRQNIMLLLRTCGFRLLHLAFVSQCIMGKSFIISLLLHSNANSRNF